MVLTERPAAYRPNVFSIHGTHWIPSEQIECRRVRTASGSDRIIKPSSKSPEHKSRHDLIKGDCRDPVATACRRVRTASGSDRIIKPSSKSPEHKSRRDLIKGDCRDPVATACRRVRTASVATGS